MGVDLFNIIENFRQFHVLVIGEAMLDSYLEGTSERICREAPVPVVVVNHRENIPGGAANTAVNVQSLGGHTIFLSVTGDDAEGDLLLRALEDKGVSTENILRSRTRGTLAKQRIIAGAQMVVRFDQGSMTAIDRKTENAFIDRLTELFPTCDALIISDYGYGILTPRVILALSQLQDKYPRVIVADSKRLRAYRSVNVTAVKPNYSEALQLLGIQKLSKMYARPDQINAYGDQILELTGAQIAAVTLDEDGALVFERDRPVYRTYAKPAPNSRAAGAGDTFVAAMTLALLSELDTPTVAEVASAASSIVVAREGTAACYADDLKAHFSVDDKYVTDAFHLAARVASYRRQGMNIVFTNGCFDILHRGHIEYLNRAKALGDILVIGLNTDESVQRLKGPNRPINPLVDRSQVLAALSCVDHIIPFDGDTPIDLIRIIQPDIFVKGGDYTHDTLPEAETVESLGGRVEILPYLEDHSTTGVIERIRKLAATTDVARGDCVS